MSEKPIIAIVGRPNVGKSCLFNRILGSRHAVVDDVSGVTRDRNYMPSAWNGLSFYVIDTGGLLPSSKDPIASEIRQQVDLAIDEADAIVFVTDAQTGALEEDVLIARQLRKKVIEKVVLVANKAESDKKSLDISSFRSLGLGDPLPVSALHGVGIGKLLDATHDIIKTSPRRKKGKSEMVVTDVINLAVVGRPNAGKSSLVNKLLGFKRMIVNDMPGTTRDAIDSMLTHENQQFRLIDTAGLRQKSHVKLDLEYYSNLRAIASINRSDVCILMIDAHSEYSEQDARILTQIINSRRGAIVCLNKWDLVEKDHKTFDQKVAELRRHYTQLKNIPIVSISALTGQRAHIILETALRVRNEMTKRIPAADFRNSLHEWSKLRPHPVIVGKEVRFLGGKQLEASYPLFQIFATNHTLVKTAYIRFITAQIYEKFGFMGCPVTLSFKAPAKPGRRIHTPE